MDRDGIGRSSREKGKMYAFLSVWEERKSGMHLSIKSHLSWNLKDYYILVILGEECRRKEILRYREWHIQRTGGWWEWVSFEVLRKVQNDHSTKCEEWGRNDTKEVDKNQIKKDSSANEEFYPKNQGKTLTCFQQKNEMTGFILLHFFILWLNELVGHSSSLCLNESVLSISRDYSFIDHHISLFYTKKIEHAGFLGNISYCPSSPSSLMPEGSIRPVCEQQRLGPQTPPAFAKKWTTFCGFASERMRSKPPHIKMRQAHCYHTQDGEVMGEIK